MGNSIKILMATTPSPRHHPKATSELPPSPPPTERKVPSPPPPGLLSSPRFSFRNRSNSISQRWAIHRHSYSLLELIALREWQQVLIRATLHPTELSQWHVWNWNHQQQAFEILPIHLACALQPPPQVIAMLLRFHSDTARSWMTTTTGGASTPRLSRRSLSLWVRGRQRRRRVAKPLRRDADVTDYSILSASSRLNSTASPNDDDEDDDCFSAENSIGDSRASGQGETKPCSMPAIDAIQEEGEEEEEDNSCTSSSQSSVDDDEDDEDDDDDDDDDDDEAFYDATSKMSEEIHADTSIHSHHSSHPVLLQLTASGGLESLTLKDSKSTEESSSTEGTTPRLNPQTPPRLVVSEKIQLLPLHVACLYHASPQVLRLLLDAFLDGIRTPCLGGMLPIHLLCSGGGNSSVFAEDKQFCKLFTNPAGPLEDLDLPQALAVIVQAYPDSRSIPCRRHGLKPMEYAKLHGRWQSDVWKWLLNPDNDEFAEDLRYHQQRMQQLSTKPTTTERNFLDCFETSSYDSPFVDDSSDTASSTGVPMDIQYNRAIQHRQTSQQLQEAVRQALTNEGKHTDNSQPRRVSLFAMLLSQEWEDALALVEEDPSQASIWHYGIDENNVPWKRLPLHLVSAWNAPVGLVQVILHAFPDAATSVDPYDGSLPLHVACQIMEPDLQVLRLLLKAYSSGTRAVDMNGRCPLHHAALGAARAADATNPSIPYAVLQVLVQEDPESVLCRDRLGKTPSELVGAMIDPSPESTTVVKFLEAIQMGLLETRDDLVCFHTNHGIEPGSHREV